jgi:hypothetical protein
MCTLLLIASWTDITLAYRASFRSDTQAPDTMCDVKQPVGAKDTATLPEVQAGS